VVGCAVDPADAVSDPSDHDADARQAARTVDSDTHDSVRPAAAAAAVDGDT